MKKQLHVHTHIAGGWCVRRQDAKRALKLAPTQARALWWAADQARRENSGTVVVHVFTGSVLGYFDPNDEASGIYR